MPTTLRVSVAPEVIRPLIQSPPIVGLEELIWNSLDAGATEVRISFEKGVSERIERVLVADNGRGFQAKTDHVFGVFGSSDKKGQTTTIDGRRMHGSEGKGRYRALSLGEIATWRSHADYLGGKTLFTTVNINKHFASEINYEDQVLDKRSCGTVVEIVDCSVDAAKLSVSDLKTELAMRFAQYLTSYSGTKIYVNDILVEVRSAIVQEHNISISVTTSLGEIKAKLVIFEWRFNEATGEPINRIFLCDSAGFPQSDAPPFMQRLSISFSAYIHCSYYDVDAPGHGVAQLGSFDSVGEMLLKEARIELRKLNKKRLRERAEEQVKNMKASEAYPFEGEPTTELEKVEREVFDIAATHVLMLEPELTSDNIESTKRKLRALRAAVTSSDKSTMFVISEVLGLQKNEINSLARLLEQVPLRRVAALAKEIVKRLETLGGLEKLLFDRATRRIVRERTQLHRILADNLWVFGDEYNLGTDDKGLKAVLQAHLKLLNVDESAFDPVTIMPSKLRDIPDLMLYKRYMRHPESFEHVVIELKAPKVLAGEKEFDQIKKYARAVSNDVRFDKQRVSWRFILLSVEFDEDTYKNEAAQVDRAEGLLLNNPNCTVWAIPWNQILHEAKVRHEFLREQLDFEGISDERALARLREDWDQYLPASLRSGVEDDDEEVEDDDLAAEDADDGK